MGANFERLVTARRRVGQRVLVRVVDPTGLEPETLKNESFKRLLNILVGNAGQAMINSQLNAETLPPGTRLRDRVLIYTQKKRRPKPPLSVPI